VFGFAEVKCRTEQIDPYKIGLHKFEALTQMARCAKTDGIVVVRWPQGIFFTNVTDGEHDGVEWMQDKRNREAADGEPCVTLSLKRFKKLYVTNLLQAGQLHAASQW
jgi:hypothetical protein